MIKPTGSTGMLMFLGNSVRGEAVLQYQKATSQEATLRIADANGKVVLVKNVDVVAGVNQYRVLAGGGNGKKGLFGGDGEGRVVWMMK